MPLVILFLAALPTAAVKKIKSDLKGVGGRNDQAPVSFEGLTILQLDQEFVLNWVPCLVLV